MQQLANKPIEGFQQTDQDHLPSKQRDKYRQSSLYFRIPQAKPLLSKQFIDYTKPKVLIKQIKISKQNALLNSSPLNYKSILSQKPILGRKQQPKLIESTLFRRFILGNTYKCIYVKYLNFNPQDLQQKGKKNKNQLLKYIHNREYLFATYIIDINFLSEGTGISYLRNLQESSFEEDQLVMGQNRNDVDFDSRFQCGNIMYVFDRVQSSEGAQYYLMLQNDINTKGYANWFFFKFMSKKKKKVTFHIVNIQKNYSFFGFGMRPVFYSYQRSKEGSKEWCYAGYNIVYQRNQILKEELSKVKYNTLSFSFDQQFDNDIIYFASQLPYSYSKLTNFLNSVEKIAKINPNLYFRKQSLTSSVSSNQCPYLTVTWKRDKKKQDSKLKKKIILLIARQHPSQIVSSYVIQGVINTLININGSQQTIELLKRYIFKIVPMVSIDGVIYGNSRCDITGSDPNRKWTKNANPNLYPVIAAIKKMVNNLAYEGYQIQYFIDFHGHSRKLGTFLYVCKTYDEIQTRMFSWIMGKINPKFSYENCRYGISNFRRQTARGYMMNIVTNRKSMTLQTSFYGYKTANGIKPFQVNDFHEIGKSIVEAIFIDTFRNSKLINWSTIRNQIKATIQNKPYQQQDQQDISGSDSNPQIDELSTKQKMQTFLSPTAATKLGLVDLKVIEKINKKQSYNNQSRQFNLLEQEQYSNHQVFNQNYDTVLNQKYLQSQMFVKTDSKLPINLKGLSKSVTKSAPFKFKSQQKKTLSLTKKIRIAIDIHRVQKKQQRLSTPSLPSVINKQNGKKFWQNLKHQYDRLLNQKKDVLLSYRQQRERGEGY